MAVNGDPGAAGWGPPLPAEFERSTAGGRRQGRSGVLLDDPWRGWCSTSPIGQGPVLGPVDQRPEHPLINRGWSAGSRVASRTARSRKSGSAADASSARCSSAVTPASIQNERSRDEAGKRGGGTLRTGGAGRWRLRRERPPDKTPRRRGRACAGAGGGVRRLERSTGAIDAGGPDLGGDAGVQSAGDVLGSAR